VFPPVSRRTERLAFGLPTPRGARAITLIRRAKEGSAAIPSLARRVGVVCALPEHKPLPAAARMTRASASGMAR
jgi:hypothetical protein